MKKSWMRLLSLLCALLMVIGQLPMLAWAEPDPANEQTQMQEDAAKPEEAAAVAGEKQDETPADPPADEQPQPDQNAAAVQPASGTDLTPATETQAPASEIQTPATETQAPPPAVNPAPAQTENQENNPPVEVNNAPENPAPTEPENPTPAEPIKPAADHEMGIGDEADFALQPGQAYTIRVPGKEGKMQVDAEAEFALKIEVKDEKSEKTKVETSNADGTFQMIYGGRSERTFLLTVTAANGQSAGTVKVSVIKYVETPKEETVVEPVNDSVNEEKNDNNEEVKEEEKKEEEDKPEETEKPEDKVEEEKTERIDQKEETKEDTKEKENTTGEKTAEGAEKPQEQPEEEKITEFACDLPGAQDISLAETITGLGITGEDEVASFMENIESVTVTDPEVVSLTQTEEDWSFRILKDSAMQESLTISMTDETVYTIATNGEGETETTSEDKTVVVSTENDFYLPEEANAYAETLTDAEHEAAVAAVQEQEADTGDVSGYQVFDIGLENVDPEQYEGFQVEVKLDEEIGGKEFKLYQVQDGTATDITDTLELKSTENEDGTQSVTSFSFSTEEFAQYVLCYTLEAFYQTQSGETYKITVNCDPEAGVPAGSTLNVREILPEEEAYQQYLNESAEKLGVSSEDVKFARFFDIEIVDKNGEKIEPTKPAQVTIAYQDALELEGEAKLNVVHFAEQGTEVIEDVQISEDKTELLYEQGSFSVTGTIITSQDLISDGETYAIIVKYQDKYYSVSPDGSLMEVDYSEGENKAYMAYPIFWTYAKVTVNSQDAYILKINSEAAHIGDFAQPDEFYYRYIDPSSSDGITTEPRLTNLPTIPEGATDTQIATINEEQKNLIKNQHNTYYSTCALLYSVADHNIIGINGKYIGVNEEEYKISGNVSDASKAAVIYFAKAEGLSPSENLKHTVNHIDISVKGKATLNVPLAYGDYTIYDEETGNEYPVHFDKNTTLELESAIPITVEDLKNAEITAFKKVNGNIEEINNAFYITGYSQNTPIGGDQNNPSSQVRIEGSFKVSDLDPFTAGDLDTNKTWPDGCNHQTPIEEIQIIDSQNNNRLQKRLDNRIYYNVTINKKIEFKWIYKDTEGHVGQLKDDQGHLLSKTVMLNLSKSFDYWDEANECPPILKGSAANPSETDINLWKQGHILWNTRSQQGSGMDFVLEIKKESDARVVAIEIKKTIQSEDGKTIHPETPVTNRFTVFQKTSGYQNDINSVQNIGISGSDDEAIDSSIYSGYDAVHMKSVIVDDMGEALVYDYDVKEGMTYIEEKGDSIPSIIIDKYGRKWKYTKTRTETEYAWRQNGVTSKVHSVNGCKSIPEIVGAYGKWNDPEDGNQEKDLFNGFLEFYVYNIYKPYGFLKVQKQVTVNGETPVTDWEKEKLAGTYTFTVYTDKDCTKPYDEDQTLQGPLTLTVTIDADGVAKDSDPVEILVGDYWLKETASTNGVLTEDIIPVTVTAETTQEKPAVAEFTNDIETGSLTVTKKVTGAYKTKATEKYEFTVKNADGKYVEAEIAQDGSTAVFTGIVEDPQPATIPTYAVQDGKTFTISNMPVGEYTVTETPPTPVLGCNIIIKYKVEDKTVTTATATVKKDSTPNVEIENNYPEAELTITKTISGLTDAQAIKDAAERITITVIDNKNNILLDGVRLISAPFEASTDGKTYSAVLKSTDQEAWAEYLVIDGEYTVVETAAEPDEYIITSRKYTIFGRSEIASEREAISGTGYVVKLKENGEKHIYDGQIVYSNTYQEREYPRKRETSPGVGVGELCPVEVGEVITYEITYKNEYTVKADIDLVDKLDKNLKVLSVDSTPAFTSETKDDTIPAIYWHYDEVEPGQLITVILTAEVLKDAKTAGKVSNQSGAKLRNETDYYYKNEPVVNPVIEKPTKKESEPYQGTGELGLVSVGTPITYEISYNNYKSSAATIKIKDVLDPNVKYIGSDPEGSYHEDGHYVTWAIPNVPKAGEDGSKGTIKLRVEPLTSAIDTDELLGKVVNGGDTTTVKVGDDPEFTLDTVENPIPIKREITPFKGIGELGQVSVGDEITYEISYKNYKTEKATITIKDMLDPNVKFVSASDDGKQDGNAVIWKLTDVAPKKEGTVTLTVAVQKTASKSYSGPGKILNNGETATVQVNDEPEIKLNTIENPVPAYPYKREISPYVGNGKLGFVKVGDEITYEIAFKNDDASSEKATIVITDILDENVEFVKQESSSKMKYDFAISGKTATWTFKDVPYNEDATVKLTVKVLESARTIHRGSAKVVNEGATVTIGNSVKKLDTVENPLLEKTERGVNNGKKKGEYLGAGELDPVDVDDVITYYIEFENYKAVPTLVTVTDKLDENLEFLSAPIVVSGSKDLNPAGKYDKDKHTVTWEIPDAEPGERYQLPLTVKVKEGAKTAGKVANTAQVKVGSDPAVDTDTVTNPVPEKPTKQETDPYKGNGLLGAVQVGDLITYEISYKNYKGTAATITIKDQLDKNVEFVSASDNGKNENGTVTWSIKDVGAGKDGKVTLTVKVLESALDSKDGPGKVVNNGETATVQVGNDQAYTLDTVTNPVPEKPTKQETKPYKGNGLLGVVQVGEQITYEISYKNYKGTAATIAIKDQLDKNVAFVSASDNGKNINGIVTWTIKDVGAGKDGKVTLTVKVLESALESKKGPGKVVNNGETATVQVGNDQAFTLDTVTNPVPEKPTKKEVSPYEGNGTLGAVGEGDEITYEISYKNYKSTAATVTIKDKLDRHVAFVSAGDGKYDKDKRTVTWTLKDVKPGEEGTVTLTVRVLSTALESNDGPGKVVNNADGRSATVQVGNDPEFMLETVENPVVARPSKRETAPYTGSGELGAVGVDDEITYEITYTNYMTSKATVTIKDKLDKNVTFISANNSGKYNKDTGIVTWTIKDVEAKKTGTVKLTVKVKDSALKSKKGPGEVVNNGETATVQVGNDKEFTLNSVVNPVPEAPVKREKLINRTKSEGTGTLATVKVGDTITYDIEYKNYQTDAATIVITDELDENVEYVQPSKTDKTVKYDKKTHTVTWTITNVKAGSSGKVTLTVKVLEGAKKATKVINTAGVKVGSDLRLYTNSVTNPVSNKNPSPNTGDDSHNGLWLTLLIISLLGCGWFGVKAFRGKGNKKPGAER